MSDHHVGEPSMNDAIARDFPQIVCYLDLGIIERAARTIFLDLQESGYSYHEFCPGDSTRYEISIVTTHRCDYQYLFASNMGAAYPWMGKASVHPNYAQEHFAGPRGNVWTAVVYSLLLNATAELIRTEW